MTPLYTDDRAQSFTYLVAGGTIIIGAGLMMVFGDAIPDLLSFADGQCVSQACTDGVSNVEAAWNWFPLFVSAMVFIMIIAASVYQSRSPTR